MLYQRTAKISVYREEVIQRSRVELQPAFTETAHQTDFAIFVLVFLWIWVGTAISIEGINGGVDLQRDSI